METNTEAEVSYSFLLLEEKCVFHFSIGGFAGLMLLESRRDAAEYDIVGDNK